MSFRRQMSQRHNSPSGRGGQIALMKLFIIRFGISDVFKDPKPQNLRGPTLNFETPTQTRPRNAEPKTTPTLDFNYKTPKSKGDVPEMLIPTQPRKVDPEPDPTPTFAPRLHH